MLLTSQIKELGAILQKLINKPGLIQVDKHDKHLIGVDGDADVLELLDEEQGAGLGATNAVKTKSETNCSLKN
jgi:hypothetical protein